MIGVKEVMEEFEETNENWSEEPPVDFKTDLCTILGRRGLDEKEQTSQLEKSILDGICGNEDKCTYSKHCRCSILLIHVCIGNRCHGAYGVDLWGRTSRLRSGNTASVELIYPYLPQTGISFVAISPWAE
jgi:hypothetical protein